MSASITFGSIGDLIAVSQIAWSLGKALKDSRGSVKEYKQLGKELEDFSNVFQQVVALWQNYEDCLELEKLVAISKTVAKDTLDILTTFRDKLNKKYGKSFDPKGSGNCIKDTGKKIFWLMEKSDIAELRRKLSDSSQAITMLAMAANGKLSKLNAETQEVRSQQVHETYKESLKLAREHVTQLEILDGKMNVQAETSKMILSSVKGITNNLFQVLAFVRDIKCKLNGLQMLCLAQEQQIRQGLGTQWQNEPAVLEDAHGNRIRLPLELFTSWETLDTILSIHFKKLPGYRKVLRREFAIEDSVSGKTLNRDAEWSMSFRPGKKADMSMLFQTAGAAASCPGCKTAVEGSTKEWIMCIRLDCGMRFRRITELVEPKSTPPSIKFSISNSPVETSTIPQPVVAEDDPADFRRVQLIQKMSQLPEKKHIHFNEQVEQCIVLDMKGDDDEEPEAYAVQDYDDSDSDDGGIMMKRSNSIRKLPPLHSKRTTPRQCFSAESKTIAVLPSTTLKYREDTPELPETAMKSSLVMTMRTIEDDEDDDEDMNWQPPSAFVNCKDMSATQKRFQNLHTSISSSSEPSGTRRTPSGMFMPYEEDEDDVVSEGLFGNVVDTVTTAKDIAHVIWNVGWGRSDHPKENFGQDEIIRHSK
ncbi:hypothetical protein DL98DRAFT_519012 [Cadophora sp. DSE1049]|nr:hypothetical protein DL98DRAFT_519012 [Cadophora sp. DSE1049]